MIVLENSEFQRFQFGGKHLVHGGSRSSCTIPGNTDAGCLGGDLHGLLHRPALCLSAQEEPSEHIAGGGGVHNVGLIGRVTDYLILIDLAVPRDIEPSVGKIQGVTLYDMDSFRIEEVPAELQENLEAAGAIVREQMDEFFQWLDGRDLIPRIQDIKDEAVNDLNLRIAKILKKTPMEEDDRQNLVHAVDTAAGKVVNKLIFGLRDSLNQEIFLECVAGLEKIYEE